MICCLFSHSSAAQRAAFRRLRLPGQLHHDRRCKYVSGFHTFTLPRFDSMKVRYTARGMKEKEAAEESKKNPSFTLDANVFFLSPLCLFVSQTPVFSLCLLPHYTSFLPAAHSQTLSLSLILDEVVQIMKCGPSGTDWMNLSGSLKVGLRSRVILMDFYKSLFAK